MTVHKTVMKCVDDIDLSKCRSILYQLILQILAIEHTTYIEFLQLFQILLESGWWESLKGHPVTFSFRVMMQLCCCWASGHTASLHFEVSAPFLEEMGDGGGDDFIKDSEES